MPKEVELAQLRKTLTEHRKFSIDQFKFILKELTEAERFKAKTIQSFAYLDRRIAALERKIIR